MGIEKDVDEPGRVELEAPVAGSGEQLAAAARVESLADDSWQTNPPTGIDGRRQGTTSTRAAAGLENEPVTVGLCSLCAITESRGLRSVKVAVPGAPCSS